MKRAKPSAASLSKETAESKTAVPKELLQTPVISDFRTNMHRLQELRSRTDDLIWRYDCIKRELDELLQEGRGIKL